MRHCWPWSYGPQDRAGSLTETLDLRDRHSLTADKEQAVSQKGLRLFKRTQQNNSKIIKSTNKGYVNSKFTKLASLCLELNRLTGSNDLYRVAAYQI